MSTENAKHAGDTWLRKAYEFWLSQQVDISEKALIRIWQKTPIKEREWYIKEAKMLKQKYGVRWASAYSLWTKQRLDPILKSINLRWNQMSHDKKLRYAKIADGFRRKREFRLPPPKYNTRQYIIVSVKIGALRRIHS